MRALTRISVAPVKGFRLGHPEHVTLTPIDFGVYAQVEQPGVVRVGDPVVLA